MNYTYWRTAAFVLLFALSIPLVAACGEAAAPEPEVVRETVVVTAEAEAAETVRETVVVEVTPTTDVEAATAAATSTEPWTTPHPVLSDRNVRQAIAYCTNRPELVQSVYPFLSEEEQEGLLMDTFLPQGHWALAPQDQITTYPFAPEQGIELLEESGWTLQGTATIRANESGEPLSLKFLTTNALFRQTWAAVFEQQLLENCGIQIIRTHAPGSYVFGETTGLQRRDFELGAFAWVGEPDPKGSTLYPCNQIPLPSNNWEGQNYMGWCNEEASRAILAANNTLDRAERIEQYGIVQREFTADMVSLPLFSRLSVAAANNNVLNYQPDPTEYHTENIDEWELADGGDTVIIGMTQEPESLFTVVHSFAAAAQLADLVNFSEGSTYNYDYQAEALTQLPTLENGGAVLSEVEVSEGDLVLDINSETRELEAGMEIRNTDGEVITYEGGSVTMPQLSVTFEYVDGITWEDGEPLKQADFELSARISCDPEVGRVSYTLCESREEIEFHNDTSYTIHYVPGALWPEYFVYSIAFYFPSHQVLADGRNLADVPASEWATLAEIAEQPLSSGPYRLVEWQKGQRMVFEANPYYYKGEPAVQNVIVSFVPDTTQLVAQLLNGTIDVVGPNDLDAGAELEVLFEAADEGALQVFRIPNPTWEHVDMNQNIR
jgi:ABC-type transport system substrate-binding protein